MSFAKLIDTSRCIGCRGCQAACKNWNRLPYEKTKNRGTLQNPPDMSASTYTIIRYKESGEGNNLLWTFLKDQCRHCVDAPCKIMADGYDATAVEKTESGAVLYTDKTAKIEDLEFSCPYNVPRRAKAGDPYVKCTLCFDRITNNLKPACVTTCPTGALEFGTREDMLKLANDRVAEIKSRYPDAHVMQDAKDVSVFYVLHYKDALFSMEADLSKHDKSRYASRRDLLNPKRIASGLSGLSKLLG
ncbi:MAG: 4Fe-4S dicluster domain-containing protein [bacterium]